MQACASATGIPLAALKAAKKRGCTAFQYSRVDLGIFIRFTYSKEGADISNWADHKLEAEAKRAWIRLAKDEGNVVDRGHVRDSIAQLAGALDSSLEKVFVSEFPPACAGLDPMAVSKLAKASKARVWEIIKSQAASITEVTPNE